MVDRGYAANRAGYCDCSKTTGLSIPIVECRRRVL